MPTTNGSIASRRARSLHPLLLACALGAATAHAHTDHDAPSGALADALRAADREGAAADAAADVGAPAAARVIADVARLGAWSPVLDWPVLPVHAALLPTGRVLAWDATPDDFDDDPHTTDNYTTRVTSWDPATGRHTQTNNGTDTDLFCAGSALLWDGRVLFAGGDGGRANANGPLSNSNLYDPWTNTWGRTDDLVAPRWYSSVAALASGEMLTFGGTYSPTPIAELFQFNKQWRPLPIRTQYTFSGDYAWLQATSGGDVMYFGPHDTLSRLDTDGAGKWHVGPTRDREGYRGYGSYAMYDIERVLVAGGGDSLASSVVVDTRSETTLPSGLMAHGRRQHNLTILADGSVFATGGNSSGAQLLDVDAGILEPELWDPESGLWTALAPAARDRQYHSIALLLPDGRVLSGGGGYCGVCGEEGYLEQNVEIFSPPYLFAADGSLARRPVIGAAPTLVDYARDIDVTTPDAARIARAHLVRLGSVTHSQNQSQRLVPLALARGADRVTLTAPANRDIAPPGHYLLFLVDTAGVPSIGEIVQIGQPLIQADEVVVNRLQAERVDYYAIEGRGEHTLSIDLRGERDGLALVLGTGRMPRDARGTGLARCTVGPGGATLCRASSLGDETWYIGVRGAAGTDYTLLAHLGAVDTPSSGGPRPGTIVAPPNVRVRALGAHAAELRWDAVAGPSAVGYEIYRDGRLVNYHTDRVHVEGSLIPGKTYRFQLVATDFAANRSAPSAAVSITIADDAFDYDGYYHPLVPSTPIGLRFERYSASAAELFWGASRDNGFVTGYDVYRDGQLLQSVQGPSYFDATLTPGASYRYFVVAVDDEQNRSSGSAEIELTPDGGPPPGSDGTGDSGDGDGPGDGTGDGSGSAGGGGATAGEGDGSEPKEPPTSPSDVVTPGVDSGGEPPDDDTDGTPDTPSGEPTRSSGGSGGGGSGVWLLLALGVLVSGRRTPLWSRSISTGPGHRAVTAQAGPAGVRST